MVGARPRSRVPLSLLRTGLFVGSVLVVLLLSEGVARVLWRDVAHRPLAAPASDLPVLSRLDLNHPNMSGLFKGTFYRTNRATLRGPEYSERPAPGVFRIAIAGDSVTAGSGVDEEDAYAPVLGRLLDAATDGPRYEVLNMGLGGLNARWAIRRMERAANTYQFHLAVYGFTPNDIEGEHYEERPGRENWVAHWASVARYQNHPSYLVRSLWPRFMSLRARTLPKSAARDEEIRWNYLENDAAFADFVSALDEFARFTREHGICGHVFIHAHREELAEIHERVAAAARARGLSVSPSMPAFVGRDESEFWQSPFDSHPNVEGHALLAQALRDGLRQSLDPACWEIERATPWPNPSAAR